jgi:signal transduction histidine kinase
MTHSAAAVATHRDHGGRATLIEISDRTDLAERMPEAQPTRAEQIEANGSPARRIAHDFNNLLGIITLNLELARERAGGGEVREMIDEALAAAWRGSELTLRLADCARPQPG